MHTKNLIDGLFEMAAAPASIAARTYYHGTSKQDNGAKILADGVIKAPSVLDLDARYGNANQRPVDGRAYLTPSLRYAIIYTIGGAMAGHSLPPHMLDKSAFGYLFQVDGRNIADVEPDEDQLGELVSKLYRLGDTRYDEYDDHPDMTLNLRKDPHLVSVLSHRIKQSLTPNMFRKSADGEASWQSKSGKRLLRMLPEYLRVKVAELGSSISVPSSVAWSGAWMFDKKLCADLKRDGSNFFELAEKVG